MKLASVDLYAMFLLGLSGTAHCIGMCGPLVLAFPAGSSGFAAHLLYHGGRITTYAAIGAVLAAVAAGSSALPRVSQAQVFFSLAAALLLFFFGLARLGLVAEPSWMAMASPARLPGFRALAAAEPKKGRRAGRMFLLGMMLGFLPCGLSLAAFARALAAGGVLAGGLLALAFGLGTLPGLLLIGTGGAKFIRPHHRVLEILSGILMAAMAVSLLADALPSIFAL